MELTDKVLNRCREISIQMLEDSMSFGPGTITDPDNGLPVKTEGYDADANQDVLVYLFLVADIFEHYYDCLRELLFFETLLSPDMFPDLPKTEDVAQYVKLNYQHWVIKVSTVFDCTLQTVNAVFELGIPIRKVDRGTLLKRASIWPDPL